MIVIIYPLEQKMLTSKKKLPFIEHQDSYYYRQKRLKRWHKCLKIMLFFILMMLPVIAFVAAAQSGGQLSARDNNKEPSKNHDNPLINGPQLIFDHPDPSMRASFPVDVEANIEINGLVAFAEIKQTFINPYNLTLAGRYQFPLPEDSAVKQLIVKVGNTEIIGEIKEKQVAKAMYKKAKRQGKKASLVEQHRPNLFTNKIANIPAQSAVVVTLKFIMPIAFSNGKFNLRLPLAMTKRYQPLSASQLGERSSDLPFSTKANKVEEPYIGVNTSLPSTDADSVARSQSSINIALNSGVAITAIASASHTIKHRALNNENNAFLITLNKTAVVSNKSFDLSWQLVSSEQPQVSSFTQEVGNEYYTLLTVFPPQVETAKVIARDIIFIIDTSGSMQGRSIQQAKLSLQLATSQLNAQDSFNIIAFDNTTNMLFKFTQMATAKNIQNAQQFINGLRADGGTEMYRPLSNALMMKKTPLQSAKALRQIVFITDGAVSNEVELVQLLNSAQENFRLYTVGIGAAPNGYFMKKAAQFGRGSYVFIQNLNEVQNKMTDFMRKISQPTMTNINLALDRSIHQNAEIYPQKIPDLYLGEPLQVAIKSQQPLNSLQVSGDNATAMWEQSIILNDRLSAKGISSLWARRKIASLLDSLVTGANKEQVKAQVIATSLAHQMISPYTSFIAVEKAPEHEQLIAKNKASTATQATQQTNKNLLVAMPQTALGWQLQLFMGIALLLFVMSSEMFLLIRKRFKWLSHGKKHR